MARKTRRKKHVTPERLQQLGFAYAPPLIISAAVSNKVFDILATGAKTVESVSQQSRASVRGLRAIMNGLVGLELLKKDRQGKYSLAPESAAFLVSDRLGTLSGFFHAVLPHMTSKWLQLTEITLTGRPVAAVNEEAEGTKFFSELVENIIPMSYPGAQKLGDHLKLAKTKNELRVLDLAAGSGIWGIGLAQKSPLVRVTAVDWAGMIPTTKRITEKFGARGNLISSKAICRRQTSATTTMWPRLVTSCTARVKNAAVSCSRKRFGAEVRRHDCDRGMAGQ
jgi:hypothetical protein